MGDFALHCECRYCGEYGIAADAYCFIAEDRRRGAALLSGYVKNRSLDPRKISPFFCGKESLSDSPTVDLVQKMRKWEVVSLENVLEFLQSRSVVQRLEDILVNLCLLSGGWTHLIDDRDLSFALYCSSEKREVFELHKELNERGWTECQFVTSGSLLPVSNVRITARGWERYEDILRGMPNVESRQGFIAMWMNPSMDEAFKEGFWKAIGESGYDPLRIDREHFINKIDDEIMAQIRKSRFVVVDVTGSRQNVLFEAGFAMGLGIPVLWTCKNEEAEVKKMSERLFDTRQFNHILWDSPEDLRTKLRARIQAVIGSAPRRSLEEKEGNR
ncbi:hypothetical protein JW916_07640 [Candidatus Sumerlaeota bacterium]|nr:hypothetical protein [Candidatus Sumerlaeota bacterium]